MANDLFEYLAHSGFQDEIDYTYPTITRIMKSNIKTQVLTSIIVLVSIGLLLIPFSLFIGWNLFTLFIFWFVLIPVVTCSLPQLIFKGSTILKGQLSGLILFYGVIILMIYEHFQSDFFKGILLSFLFNLIAVSIHHISSRSELKKEAIPAKIE